MCDRRLHSHVGIELLLACGAWAASWPVMLGALEAYDSAMSSGPHMARAGKDSSLGLALTMSAPESATWVV